MGLGGKIAKRLSRKDLQNWVSGGTRGARGSVEGHGENWGPGGWGASLGKRHISCLTCGLELPSTTEGEVQPLLGKPRGGRRGSEPEVTLALTTHRPHLLPSLVLGFVRTGSQLS